MRVAPLLLLGTAEAFVAHQHGARSLLSSLTAKTICTFDGDDFAGDVGDWPYSAADLGRLDSTVDTSFYAEPRFVTHIDDGAIKALTEFYSDEFKRIDKESLDVLDLCSSWISHLPPNGEVKYGEVVGLGMNEQELAANKALTSYVVQDLNENPSLQFEDDSFDVVCNVVSVDYLTQPLDIFQEVHRILRPGGISLMSFSNRCFPTKAVAMWLQADDIGRLTIVGSYYHYSANWSEIEALDLKDTKQAPERPSPADILKNPSLGLAWMNAAAAVAQSNAGDPMYVVRGIK